MFIRDIVYLNAKNEVNSKSISKMSGLEQDFIENKIGIKKRYLLSKDESQVSLSKAVCENLFSNNQDLYKENIKLLVVVTQNPDYKLPHSSAILQAELKLSNEVICFDVNLGCSGYVYSLSIVRGLMLTEELENAILITCDPYSRIINKYDKNTSALFGDGASATWLSSKGGHRIGKIDFGTDGNNANALELYNYSNNNEYLTLSSKTIESKKFLYMNGRTIFNFMLKRIPISIERCLQKNNLHIDDIDYFVFHQASRFLLETLVKKLNLPIDKVPIMLESTGNTISSTIPFVLCELNKSKCLIGKKIMICGFGVGLSWACNILYFGGSNE